MTAPTLPDVDQAPELLADVRPPCDVGRSASTRCAEPAEWIVRVACHCGWKLTELICHPHHDEIAELAEHRTPRCLRCRCAVSVGWERL